MALSLEDNFTDIIGKAQRGLEISDSDLAKKSGVPLERIRQVRDGEVDENAILKIAPVLELDPETLVASARKDWTPTVAPIEGLAQFVTPFHDMKVNAYLVWDPTSREAIAFDTGMDCTEMLDRVEREKLTVKMILLTHSHTDHIADLSRLQKKTGVPTFISERERASGAEGIAERKSFAVGKLRIESLLTSGHSAGGMTFVVSGLAQPIAIVGDSLFAGSMGGGMVSYTDALNNNFEKIMTLPNETILCPGHGPLTTVAEEKKHNPFFAGKVRS